MKHSTNTQIIFGLVLFFIVSCSFSCKQPGREKPEETQAESVAAPTPEPAVSPVPLTEDGEDAPPRLIVGIVVDQMAYDFLDRFRDKYGEDGFKRLLGGGFSYGNAKFNYVPTTTCPGHASIYTGTTPSVHGIIGNDWFVRAPDNGETYCARDKSVSLVGDGGDGDEKAGQLSPRKMLASTVTDELRLSSRMESKVIGIALKDRAAIMPAGHLGNAAYWLDDESGMWVTSTYYYRDMQLPEGAKPSLPAWVEDFNTKYSAEKYVNMPGNDGVWNTLMDITKYTESLPDDNVYEKSIKGRDEKTGEYRKPVFPYVLKDVLEENKEETKGQYGRLIKVTPFGNSITKDFALAAIRGEGLGKDGVTDFLAVSFSSTDIIGHYYGPRSIEVEDAYIRIDLDIADLLEALDSEVGEDNYLVFLTADHGAGDSPLFLGDTGMPSGYFMEDDQVITGLKKHLGEAFRLGGLKFVLAYNNQQVYLDRDLITNKLGLSLEDVEKEAASYLMTLDGVADAVTASELKASDFTTGARHLVENGYNRKRSGDVIVIMEPGWIEYKSKFGKKGTTHGAPYDYDTHVPLIFYGRNIKKGESIRPVYINDIAPTVSALLKIPYPNGTTGNPLLELFE
ncbi:MAG TPA: alkaline phosphatase PafA [Thermodesulfobacteriota bacterium]|nr:alkaline phosphatase PafA [Thermodesulfobacteriota bacterium]